MANPLGTKLGSAFFEVSASFAGFGDSLTSGVIASITSSGVVLGNAMENLGKDLFKRFTIPLGIAAAANVAQFAQLERAVAETLTLFGTAPTLVDSTFDAMSAGITRVSREVGGLEKDLADGLYQTISAGVDRDDAFGFLSVAQTAAIADKTADVATAVDGLTTSVNAFGLEASDVGRVADVMFATVAKGKTTFGELSTDIGRVAPLASNAGASLEETYAILGQLTKQGLQTSEAVSYLRGAITGLLRPGDEMNEIFAKLGFESAEAAIPVLGLQGAFQAVESASGGSVSKLQELLGVAEGVNAVLGVTGDNADSFASVLTFVENSAGATANAFDIVDATVSRSFGKMTESFDRLGNLFGSMGAEFAQPVVDTITSIVDGIATVFQNLVPVARNAGELFGDMMGVFDNPVVKGFAVALASVAISAGALLGVLGGILVPLGNLVVLIFQAASATTIFKASQSGLQKIATKLGTTITAMGEALLRYGGALVKSAVPATTAFGRAMQTLGKAMAAPLSSTLLMTGAIIGLVAVIAGGIYLWSRWRDATREAFERNQTFTKGVDTLADSLGIAGQQISFAAEEMDKFGASESAFREINSNLIKEVQEISDRVGEVAARDFIISIGAQLQFEGATPEEAFMAIQKLASELGIELNIDINDFLANSKNVNELFGGITASAQSLDAYLQGFGPEVQKFAAGTGEAQGAIHNIAQGLGEAYVRAVQTNKLGTFKNLAQDALSSVDNVHAVRDILRATYYAIEDIKGEKLGVEVAHTSTFEEFIAQMEGAGTIFENVRAIFEQPLQLPEPVEGSTETNLEDFQKRAEGAVQWTEQQVKTITDLRFSVDEIMKAGTDAIDDWFNAVKSNVLEQMPLLGIYEGAIEQTFAEWEKSQNKFQEDLANVSTARQRLVDEFGAGSDVVKAFDAEPLSSQAWFAQLGGDNLETAITELQESYQAGIAAAVTRTDQDEDAVLNAAATAMQEKFDEMSATAAEQGRIVSDSWKDIFETESAGWAVSAQTIVDQVKGILETPIAGPIVGPIRFSDGSFTSVPGVGGDSSKERYQSANAGVTVNVYNPSVNSLPGDTERAAGIVRSARLGEGIR